MKNRPALLGFGILFSFISALNVYGQSAPAVQDLSIPQPTQDSIHQDHKIGPFSSETNHIHAAPDQGDSAKAVRNLYHRKRRNGITRAVIFGALALTSLYNTINYQPTTVTVNQGTPYAQTITVDDSPPVGNYLGIGIFAALSISGMRQASFYSDANMNSTLAEMEKGWPLPEKIKRKLRKKDFRRAK